MKPSTNSHLGAGGWHAARPCLRGLALCAGLLACLPGVSVGETVSLVKDIYPGAVGTPTTSGAATALVADIYPGASGSVP
jgi:hypothetical protein